MLISIEPRFSSYYNLPLRLNRNISGIAHLMETVDRALRKGKVRVYSGWLAVAVVQAQPNLRAFVAAGAILVIRHPLLLSIRVFFCLSGGQHFSTGVSCDVESENARMFPGQKCRFFWWISIIPRSSRSLLNEYFEHFLFFVVHSASGFSSACAVPHKSTSPSPATVGSRNH